MADLDLIIQQQNGGTTADGSSGKAQGLRDGSLITADPASLYQKWLRAGKVFEAHFATETGTATIEANAAYDLTEPFFRLCVPSSKLFVPIQVKITPTTVWVTTDGITLMASADAADVVVNAGGAAPDVRNLAVVNANESSLGDTAMTSIKDGDSVITEDALTSVRIIDNIVYRTGGLFEPYEYNILKGDPMAIIHGPGRFLVQAMLAGALECQYTIKWAELDKSELVNS